MRRWWVILLCVLLGAMVNVVVAWGCELWSAPPTMRPSHEESGAGWPLRVPESWPRSPQAVLEHRWFGITEISAGTAQLFGVRRYAVVMYESGWPMRTLRRHTWAWEGLNAREVPWANSCRFTPAIELPAWVEPACERGSLLARFTGAARSPTLSILPIWPGVVANTMVYCAAIWSLAAGAGSLRRRGRRRRGLCQGCAYDLHGVMGECPECGGVGVRA